MPFGLPSQRQKDLDRKAGSSQSTPPARSPPKSGRQQVSSSSPDDGPTEPTQEEEELAQQIEIGTLSADPEKGEAQRPAQREGGRAGATGQNGKRGSSTDPPTFRARHARLVGFGRQLRQWSY